MLANTDKNIATVSSVFINKGYDVTERLKRSTF